MRLANTSHYCYEHCFEQICSVVVVQHQQETRVQFSFSSVRDSATVVGEIKGCKMENNKEIILTALSESATIVTGIFLGEIVHRVFTPFLHSKSSLEKREKKIVRKSKKERRNTGGRYSSYFDQNFCVAASISLCSYFTFSGIFKVRPL